MDFGGRLVALSVLKEQFDNNQNIIESYASLLEILMSEHNKKYISIDELQTLINIEYHLQVPLPCVRSMASTLCRNKKLVSVRHDTYEIIFDRLEIKQFELASSKVKINNLQEQFSQYALKRGEVINKQEVTALVCMFLYRKRGSLMGFFNYTTDLSSISEEYGDVKLTNLLVEFIIKSRSEKASCYETIKELYGGVLLSSLFEVSNRPIESVLKKNQKINSIYLDTSFILRLLDLQTELEYEAARQTLQLIRNSNIRIFVLDITLNELCSVLTRFIEAAKRDGVTWKRIGRGQTDYIDGLANSYVRRDLTPSFLSDTLSDIENVLRQNFSIIIQSTENYKIVCNSELEEELKKLKNKKPDEPISKLFNEIICHDLKAIEFIRILRGNQNIYNFDSAHSFMLTNDYRLANWNQKRHANNSSIAECISEEQLSNMLWLSNPTVADEAGLSNMILAFRSNHLADESTLTRIACNIRDLNTKYSQDEDSLSLIPELFNGQNLHLGALIQDELDNPDASENELIGDWLEKQIRIAEDSKKQKDALLSQSSQEIKQLNEKFKQYSSEKEAKTTEYIETRILDLSNTISAQSRSITLCSEKLINWKNIKDKTDHPSKWKGISLFIIIIIGYLSLIALSIYLMVKTTSLLYSLLLAVIPCLHLLPRIPWIAYRYTKNNRFLSYDEYRKECCNQRCRKLYKANGFTLKEYTDLEIEITDLYKIKSDNEAELQALIAELDSRKVVLSIA